MANATDKNRIAKGSAAKSSRRKKEKKPRVILDLSGKYPQDENGRYIVPDDFMDEHYRELPDGTVNQSRTFRAYKGGKMRSLGGDPEKDKEIYRKGAEVLNANLAQRKTIAETIEDLLRKKASRRDLEELGMDQPAEITRQEAVVAAVYLQALKGNVKAATFIRDTIGEMPVSKQEITADVMTDADRALMEKLDKRMRAQGKN